MDIDDNSTQMYRFNRPVDNTKDEADNEIKQIPISTIIHYCGLCPLTFDGAFGLTKTKLLTRLCSSQIAFLEDNPSGRMDKKRFLYWCDLLKPDFDIKDEVACENAFAAFDKNKDGTIDFKEFTTALAFLGPNTVETHVDLFFQMYDISDDGCLDYQELIDAFESIIYLLALRKKTAPKSAKQMASEVFAMFGLNDDAKISKEQFIERLNMLGDTFYSTIELLSVELWQELFEYFTPNDLWYSFHDLNRKINAIIDQTILYLNFTKQGTYRYFVKNILTLMNVVNVRSLKFNKSNEIRHFFSKISLNSLVQLRVLSLDFMYSFDGNSFTFWKQLSSLKYLQSLKIIFWASSGSVNCCDEKKYIIRSIFNNNYCPSLKSFMITTGGIQQGRLTIPSLISTTTTTNIQNLSINSLTFNDLIKLLPAMQNVKSFCIDYDLRYDNWSNEQQQSMVIDIPLLPKCIDMNLKLSDDITFEHVEYLLKHTQNLKKLFMWGWYHLFDAMKWEFLLSMYCSKLIKFHLICSGPIWSDEFDQIIDNFQQIYPTRLFWIERNITISDDDVSGHDYRSDIAVEFNIKNKVSSM
ncbi:unnamed protein product [Rotaria sordida]|uniref:EF-hand domain-containing protein n=1 Tax=Rotaria sordida TaxID=392033 RepID=A0A818RRG1_9BILA|nr:unnamed protein product [Rotaria sordida]